MCESLLTRLREKRPWKGKYDDEAADRIEELEAALRTANLLACLVPHDKTMAVLNSRPTPEQPE